MKKPQLSDDSRVPTWRDALVVFSVALSYRLAYLFEASRSDDFSLLYMDQEYHVGWAQALLSGQWVPPFDALYGAAFFRAPLYPYFLAGIFAMVGPNPLAARLVQMVIGSISCALAYAVGTQVFGRRVGLLSGLFCSVYWVLAYFDGELLIPVLLVALVLLGFFLVIVAVKRSSPFISGASGLALGLSAIARPNMLVFLPVAIWWTSSRVRDLPRAMRSLFVALFVLGCFLPSAVVTWRNYRVADDWVVVASQGGVNFYIGNNPQSDGMQAVVPGTSRSWWGGYEETVEIAEQAAGRKLAASEVSSYWFREAFRYIREQPAHWLRLTLRKTLAFVGNVEIPNNEPYEARRERYRTLRLVPLGFGLFFGLFACSVPSMLREEWSLRLAGDRRSRPDPRWSRLILLFVAVYSASVVMFFVTGRYRLPVVPFVVMGAAATVITLFDLARTKAVGRGLVGFVSAAILVAVLNVDHLDVRSSTRSFALLSDALDLIELGRPAEAIPSLEAIRAEGRIREPGLYSGLIRLYLGRNSPGDRAIMLELVEEGLPLHPDDAELLWLGTVTHFEARNLDTAQGYIDRYLRQRPEEIRGLTMATRISAARGDRRSAMDYIGRAESIAPDDPDVLRLKSLVTNLPD